MLCDDRDHASPSQHASATRVKRYTTRVSVLGAESAREVRVGGGKARPENKEMLSFTVTVVGEMVHLNIQFPSPKPKTESRGIKPYVCRKMNKQSGSDWTPTRYGWTRDR